MNDLRHAIRMLLKHPGFTTVAVLTLALGIGANTVIYSMVNAMFLRPLPVTNPQDLTVMLQKTSFIPIPIGFPYSDFKDLRQRNDVFADMIAYMPAPVQMAANGKAPENFWVELVSPNYFNMLGISAQFGRVFATGEGEALGADPLIVLTYQCWQQRFGGDPGLIGRSVHLNGKPFTVIGITPPSFRSTEWSIAISGFIPAMMANVIMKDGDQFIQSRSADAFRLMGRLRPGVSLSEARSSFEVLYKQLASEYPKNKEKKSPLMVSESRARPDPAFSEFGPMIVMLFAGLAGLVLLIACANVANLMLTRAVDRTREMAIRSSLGASRLRLLRQWFTESVVLALAAAAFALFVALWIERFLDWTIPQGSIPVRTDHRSDWTVVLFSILCAVVAGAITGLLPAWRVVNVNMNAMLKQSATAVAGPARHRLRALLVVSQVSICLVLLVCSGLFLRSLRSAADLDLGFRPANALIGAVDLDLKGYDSTKGRLFQKRMLQELRALPSVESASLASTIPFDYHLDFADITIDGGIPQAKDDFIAVNYSAVDTDYFAAAGTPLMQGRGFNDADHSDSVRVAVVNQTLAQRLWPNQNAIGKRLKLRRDGPWLEVVGLTGTGKYFMLSEEPRPYIYLPLAQEYAGKVHLVIRSKESALSTAPAIRKSVSTLDPDLPVSNLTSLQSHLDNSFLALMPLRLGLYLAGIQGILGLLLGMLGLYAVVSYSVRARTREIGVRIALGAQNRDIFRLVVYDGMRLLVIGSVLGLLLSIGTGVGLSKLLYGLQPIEVSVLFLVTLLLSIVSFIACWMPARRALHVDPMTALRDE